MKKFKTKNFAIIFFTLLIIQFVIVYLNVKLDVKEITSPIISIMSLPIGMVNENLPFYVRESLYIKIIYWMINVFVQTTFIYMGIRAFIRLRNKLKKTKRR